MSSDDSEATTQPLVDNKELGILKAELNVLNKKLEIFTRENEILTKENVKLKLENERLSNEQARNRYETRDYSQEPTDEEAKVLKLLQPPGRELDADTIAQRLGMNRTTAEYYLNELVRKDYVYELTTQAVAGFRATPTTYSLTSKGVKFLVEHNLTE